jgi:hypothetical protein
MSYIFVVARYNENIDWLEPEKDHCIIYNKGEKLQVENEIMLNNVGRESETYLHYIITNYDNLPDIVIFTQAMIEDHREIDPLDYLYDLREEAMLYGKSNYFMYHYNDYSENFPNWDSCWTSEWNILEDGSFFLPDNYYQNTPVRFIDWFKKNVNEDYPDPIHIYCNGLFAVRKEKILRRSLHYYQQLILQVNHHINPVEGHFFERSWFYIFA